MSGYRFVYDERLGIPLPQLDGDWDQYDVGTREQILLQWEQVRGQIPDRIVRLEQQINRKQRMLYEEEDFDASCRLNSEIAVAGRPSSTICGSGIAHSRTPAPHHRADDSFIL